MDDRPILFNFGSEQYSASVPKPSAPTEGFFLRPIQTISRELSNNISKKPSQAGEATQPPGRDKGYSRARIIFHLKSCKARRLKKRCPASSTATSFPDSARSWTDPAESPRNFPAAFTVKRPDSVASISAAGFIRFPEPPPPLLSPNRSYIP